MTTHAAPTSIVVGTDGSRRSAQAVRRAGLAAQSRGQVLHLVAAYELRDTTAHRMQRAVAPVDVCHTLSPVGEAEDVLHEALDALTGIEVDVLTHARHGSLTAAVRRVAKETGGLVITEGPQSPVRSTFARLTGALRGSATA